MFLALLFPIRFSDERPIENPKSDAVLWRLMRSRPGATVSFSRLERGFYVGPFRMVFQRKIVMTTTRVSTLAKELE